MSPSPFFGHTLSTFLRSIIPLGICPQADVVSLKISPPFLLHLYMIKEDEQCTSCDPQCLKPSILSTEGNYNLISYVFYLEVFCCVMPCKANLIYPGMHEAAIMVPAHYDHFPF